MFKRFITRTTGFKFADTAEWEKLYDSGYRDVPRYIAEARHKDRLADRRSHALFGRTF